MQRRSRGPRDRGDGASSDAQEPEDLAPGGASGAHDDRPWSAREPGHAGDGQELREPYRLTSAERDHALPGPTGPNQHGDGARRPADRPEAEGPGVEPGVPHPVNHPARDGRFERRRHDRHAPRRGVSRNGKRDRLTGHFRPEEPQGIPTTLDHEAARQADSRPHRRGEQTPQGIEMRRAKPAPEAVWGRDFDQGHPQEGLRRAEREPIQRRETQTPPHGREREVAGKPGAHEAVECLHGLPRDPGEAPQRIGHSWARMGGEERQDFVAHLVPEELRVTIRLVLHDLDTVGREVGEHRGATDVEQGPDDPASPHRDPCEPTGPGPLKDPHENGLGLIVGGVAEGDALGPKRSGDLAQRRVASEAGGLLGRPASRAGDLDPDDAGGTVQAGRQGLDERGVPVCLGSKTVVYVTDGEPEREFGAEKDERVQEGDRVGAARNPYEDVVSRVDEPVTDQGRPHGRGQE